jgi:hypothetical protein
LTVVDKRLLGHMFGRVSGVYWVLADMIFASFREVAKPKAVSE